MDTVNLTTPIVVNHKGFEIESFPTFSSTVYDGFKGQRLKDEISWYLSLCLYTQNDEQYWMHWNHIDAVYGNNRVIRNRIHDKAIAWARLYKKLNK